MRSLSERAKDLADAARTVLDIGKRMREDSVPSVEVERAEKRLRYAIEDVEDQLAGKRERARRPR